MSFPGGALVCVCLNVCCGSQAEEAPELKRLFISWHFMKSWDPKAATQTNNSAFHEFLLWEASSKKQNHTKSIKIHVTNCYISSINIMNYNSLTITITNISSILLHLTDFEFHPLWGPWPWGLGGRSTHSPRYPASLGLGPKNPRANSQSLFIYSVIEIKSPTLP